MIPFPFVRRGTAAAAALLAGLGVGGGVLPVRAAAAAGGDGLPPLRVQGRELVADGKPVRLRGIDWGWWHLGATVYRESDMRQQAAWGANVARLVFSYYDLQNPDGSFSEEGFKKFDDVIRWGRKYGVYVILDMHTVPGGQSHAAYCDGGKDRIWSDAEDQKKYFALWAEIARRYRNRPEVAAYELMNEPQTDQKSPERLMEIEKRALAAIRAADPDKIVVICGDHGSGARDMVDGIKVNDPKVLYTFHFYNRDAEWKRNLKDNGGIQGTQDWRRLEETFAAPADVSQMAVLLRSSANSGTAWFDDVRLEDTTSGEILYSSGFDRNADSLHPERVNGKDTVTYDASIGHDKPGSLRVSGTATYNGWAGNRFVLRPGHAYRLSAWVKLDNATGDTFLSAAFYQSKVDPKALRAALAPPIAFAKKFNVPVWVGEFGYEQWVPPAGTQSKWVTTCIGLFEEAGFDWSYWNYKESTGPTSMALEAERKDGTDYPVNEPLLDALRAGWRLNGKAAAVRSGGVAADR